MKQKDNIGMRLMGIGALAMMMAFLCGIILPVTGRADDTAPAAETPTVTSTEAATEAPTTTSPYKPANPNRFQRLTVKQSGPKLNLNWDRMKTASAYKIYGGYTGESMKLIKTIKDNKVKATTIKKLNKMKLDRTRVFKFKLLVYQNVDGKDKLIVKSPAVYVAGSQHPSYTNVKKLKVPKLKVNLTAGKKVKNKASVTRENKKRAFLPDVCGPKVSYFSSNNNVATVTAGGTIKGVAPGKCTVYVYTVNGLCKKVNVNVK